LIGVYAPIVQDKICYATDAMNAMTARQDLQAQDVVNAGLPAVHISAVTARYLAIIDSKKLI